MEEKYKLESFSFARGTSSNFVFIEMRRKLEDGTDEIIKKAFQTEDSKNTKGETLRIFKKATTYVLEKLDNENN